MATLPYGAIRVLDVGSEDPRVLVRLELTYAELADLQQAAYAGSWHTPHGSEGRKLEEISNNLLRVCRDLALEDKGAYKELAPGYIQEPLW